MGVAPFCHGLFGWYPDPQCNLGGSLGHLSRVLQLIRQVGLHIKARKCSFVVNECMGHIIGKGKIQPMQCNVDGMQTFTQPTTKKLVQAFMGYVGTTENSYQTFGQ